MVEGGLGKQTAKLPFFHLSMSNDVFCWMFFDVFLKIIQLSFLVVGLLLLLGCFFGGVWKKRKGGSSFE